jgi:hypothetical protein
MNDWRFFLSEVQGALSRHPVQQWTNVFPRNAPVFAFSPVDFLVVVDGFLKPLKRRDHLKFFSPNVSVNVLLDQSFTIRVIQSRQDL